MPSPAATSRGILLSALAAALAGGCLVKDIELVDTLPGASGSSASGGNTVQAGSPNTAGNSSSSDGGEDAAAGDGSGGSQPGAGSGGNPTGGMDQGGSAGMASGGMNQGGSTPIEIPELGACNGVQTFCDDFEQGTTGQWPPGVQPELSPDDPPSGTHVLISNFMPTSLTVDLTAVSISMWARFDGLYDQRVVSFRDVSGPFLFGVGREGGMARWIYGEEGIPETIASPDDDALTRPLEPEQWFCLQIRADTFANSFEARVVVPGDPPFDLPILDQNPTSGVDELWNGNIGTWGATPDELVFGQSGAYQLFDDVLIGEYDEQTLCDLFIASGVN